jgi:hypothetical protein
MSLTLLRSRHRSPDGLGVLECCPALVRMAWAPREAVAPPGCPDWFARELALAECTGRIGLSGNCRGS